MPSRAPPAIAAVCQSTVSPAAIVSRNASSGPMTGMISRMPTAIPSSSQYGSPISQNENETTVETNPTSTIWPRTNAPSFRSISCHVSLAVFRFGRGMKRVTRSIA